MNTKETKEKIKELQNQMNDIKKELKRAFYDGLKEIFEKNPAVVSVRANVNNHEFNDGDQTYFSLCCDDLTATLKDGTEVDRFYEADSKEYKEISIIIKNFVNFFEEFDVDDFYEKLFSDAYESILFSFDGKKVSVE